MRGLLFSFAMDEIQLAGNEPRSHEVLKGFRALGLPLNPTLESMLDEHHTHRTERRGSGFTQATRHLAEYINYPCRHTEYDDARLFADKSPGVIPRLRERALELGLELSWRNLDRQRLPTRAALDPELSELLRVEVARQRAIREAPERFEREESRLLARIMSDLVLPVDARELGLEELPLWSESLKIGTCPLAEKYFLELAERFVRRRGRLNIISGADATPLMIEKLNLGDDHSCISVVPLVMNGVRLPAGSLLGVRYDEPAGTRPNAELPGEIIPLGACRGFRFLRLTTLSVSPANRPRAFSKHFEAQVQGGLFGPGVVEISQLFAVAKAQLGGRP